MVRTAEPSASAPTTASATLFPASVFVQSEGQDLDAMKSVLKGHGALGVSKTAAAANIRLDVIPRPASASVRPVTLAATATKVCLCVV